MRRDRRERGEVTTAVVLIPVVLVMVMVVIQMALVFHARSVITAAATDAARAAQAEGGTEGDGQAVARQLLAGSESLVSGTTIDVDRSSGRVAVTIDAHVVSLIPGWTLSISAHSEGPIEEFRTGTTP